MAVNLIFGTETSKIIVIVVLYVISADAQASSIVQQVEGCRNSRNGTLKETCFTLDLGKANEVNITSMNAESLSILCFRGLKLSPFYLWANPVLRLVYNEQPAKWNTYYGGSVQEVRNSSMQAGMSVSQLMLYFKMYQEKEEISLDPFNTSCVAILTEISFQSRLHLKNPDMWYVAYLATGIVLFFSAKTWSQNTSLHYGSGVTVGVLASLLILFFMLGRLFPQRLKNIAYVFMISGWSVSMYFLTWIANCVSGQLAQILLDYWKYIIGYIIVTGFISFCIVYKFGPVTNKKSLNLIKWMLQFIGLALVYNGSQIREISFAFIIITLAIYNFPVKVIFNNYNRSLWYTFFPPERRLLTEDEYNRQAHEETRNALEKLRSFCQSPECDSWKIVSSIKNPQRFAQFIEGNSWHVTDDELMEYDSGPEATPAMSDGDSDEDSEMDFQLGSF